MESDSDVGLVYSWSVDIDENDRLAGEVRASHIQGQVYQTLMLHNFMGNASCSMMRRACLEKVKNYNCQLKEQNAQGGEDWELYIHIAEQYKFRVVPEFLVGYRKFSESMSCNYMAMAKSHYLMWQSIRQKNPKIPILIYKLSSSSFYMYLGRQSYQNGHYKSTLLLLYKALQADIFTPFLRLGFYTLAIASCFKLITRSIFATDLQNPAKSKPKKDKAKTLPTSELEKQQIKTRIKVLVENVLHHSIPTIFGSTQSWR